MTPLIPMLLLAAACGDKDGGDTGAAGGDLGAVQSESLGSHTTDTGGLTGAIPLSVPEGTSSMVVHCGPFGYDKLGTAWQIVDPGGSDFYTNGFFEGHVDTRMRVGNHDDYLPVLMPISPDQDISAGDWNIDVWIAAGGSPTTIDCAAVYRVESASSSPTVDINAVFVGLSDLGIDASTAADDADFQAALDFAESLWSDAGLSLGTVNYYDFGGNVDRFQVVDVSDTDTSELGDLFQNAPAGASARALTVYFVEEISSSSGSTILGIAAGPPGAATVDGTSKSGMAVTTADLRDSSDDVGLILAHEGAHFMGLFHTSEKLATAHDPLDDTPECPASADGDSNGLLDREECAGKGAENVMFWAPSPSSSTTMSSDQGWVLERNPAAR